MRFRLLAFVLALAALAACGFDSGPRDIDALPGGGAGTNAAPQGTPGPHGGPVLAIGDSLLVGAINQGNLILTLETDGWVPETIAETGRSVPWATQQIDLRLRVPRYVVVVLGSNPGFSSTGFREDVAAFLDSLIQRGARRIVWIPPHHTDPTRYAEKVAILRDADRLNRRLVVPDWGSMLDANPQWIGYDGLHLTEQGYLALASFIRDRLARLG